MPKLTSPVLKAVSAYSQEKFARQAVDRAQAKTHKLVGYLTPEEFQEYASITQEQDDADNAREEALDARKEE